MPCISFWCHYSPYLIFRLHLQISLCSSSVCMQSETKRQTVTARNLGFLLLFNLSYQKFPFKMKYLVTSKQVILEEEGSLT